MIPISVCLTGKDRSNLFRKSLKSLHNQSYQPACISISDASEDRDSFEAVIEEFKEYSPIKIVHTWNSASKLSIAEGRNLSRKNIDTPLMLNTETDILFPRHALMRSVLHFQKYRTSEYKPWITPMWHGLDPEGKVETKKHCRNGSFQLCLVEDFDKVGGYNPLLPRWGYEDTDFRGRMYKLGYASCFLDFVIEHQWHPPQVEKKLRKSQIRRNKMITKITHWDGEQWIYKK